MFEAIDDGGSVLGGDDGPAICPDDEIEQADWEAWAFGVVPHERDPHRIVIEREVLPPSLFGSGVQVIPCREVGDADPTSGCPHGGGRRDESSEPAVDEIGGLLGTPEVQAAIDPHEGAGPIAAEAFEDAGGTADESDDPPGASGVGGEDCDARVIDLGDEESAAGLDGVLDGAIDDGVVLHVDAHSHGLISSSGVSRVVDGVESVHIAECHACLEDMVVVSGQGFLAERSDLIRQPAGIPHGPTAAGHDRHGI